LDVDRRADGNACTEREHPTAEPIGLQRCNLEQMRSDDNEFARLLSTLLK
jgi:hypothetical protein